MEDIMLPVLPLVGWIGGIGASAQVVAGVVRGVGRLRRGRPGAAFIEMADGLVAPLRSTCRHLAELGGDVADAILGTEEPVTVSAPVQTPTRRRRRARATVLSMPSANGDA
jgi:hypothetical protein